MAFSFLKQRTENPRVGDPLEPHRGYVHPTIATDPMNVSGIPNAMVIK